MTTLTRNRFRRFSVGVGEFFTLHEMVAADTIYKGSAVGLDAGLARPLQTTDTFVGFAEDPADNEGGAATARKVRVRVKGLVDLSVVGVAGVGDIGDTVYASDDDTFTLTVGTNKAIGKVHDHLSGELASVAFEGEQMRSL